MLALREAPIFVGRAANYTINPHLTHGLYLSRVRAAYLLADYRPVGEDGTRTRTSQCPRQESNLHAVRQRVLSAPCLTIPTTRAKLEG